MNGDNWSFSSSPPSTPIAGPVPRFSNSGQGDVTGGSSGQIPFNEPGDRGQSININISTKLKKQLFQRGWTEESVQNTVDNQYQMVVTTDNRHLPGGGTENGPATAYINKDGSYVVRNDKTGDIAQISNRNDPDWRSPFPNPQKPVTPPDEIVAPLGETVIPEEFPIDPLP